MPLKEVLKGSEPMSKELLITNNVERSNIRAMCPEHYQVVRESKTNPAKQESPEGKTKKIE